MSCQAYPDLLSELAEMPFFLRRSAESLPRKALVRQPKADELPLLVHLWHLRDCECDLYAARIRRVLQESEPLLESVDVAPWPAERGYLARDGKLAVDDFARFRHDLLAVLRGLPPSSLERTGIRSDGQRVTVLDLVGQIAEHDRDHRTRIALILEEYVS